MVCYYDYALHLCSWENKSTSLDLCDVQDAEIRIYGIHGQLDERVQLALPILYSLQSLVNAKSSTAAKAAAAADEEAMDAAGEGDEDEASSSTSILEDVSNSLITSLIHSYLSLATATLFLSKICLIESKPVQCLAYFQSFLPILKESVGDKVVCQLYLQSYLDILCHVIQHTHEAGSAHRIEAFEIGIEFVKQTKHYYWNVPYNIIGSEAIIFFESAFRSYVTIFQLVVLLNESDFLSQSGLDLMKLLNAISTSLQGFFEWMQKQNSAVMNMQTLVSLRMAIEISLQAAGKYPSATTVLYHVIRLSRLLLVISSSRFFVAKILLDQLIFAEEVRLAQILASASASASAASATTTTVAVPVSEGVSFTAADLPISEQQRNLLFPIAPSMTIFEMPMTASAGTAPSGSATARAGTPSFNIPRISDQAHETKEEGKRAPSPATADDIDYVEAEGGAATAAAAMKKRKLSPSPSSAGQARSSRRSSGESPASMDV
jgi:hypothetical protein